MDSSVKQPKDQVFIAGIILLLFSLIFYLLPLIKSSAVDVGGLFLANYGFTMAYFLILVFSGFRRSTRQFNYLPIFLVLSLISAYSLNREMAVFEKSATWFAILLVVLCINYLSLILFEKFPEWLKYITVFICGIGMITFFYLAIYLVPIYLLSTLALIGLGISFHTFVPFLFCLYTFFLLRKINSNKNKYLAPFITGAAASVVVIIVYTVQWNSNLAAINKNFKYSSITENNQLPSWINVAREMPKNKISEKILKTELIYTVPGNEESFFWRMPRLNFERKVHDPFVVMGTFFCGKLNVPIESRIKILESIYDSRHEAQERLWSGDDLVTEEVNTTVQLWPEHRLSYTETNIIVSNIPNNTTWTNQQEAIYTFHLPEGGVATSLSLWIEGREEKAILTTKEKADSAYKTIVGVESRDPSVVHWQEGNILSVRVFPVLKGESRKFKLGITAPLSFTDNRLKYNNIYFDGPSFDKATEKVSIYSQKNPLAEISVSPGFSGNENQLNKTGKYSPSWYCEFTAPPLSADNFSFDNHSYSIISVRNVKDSFNASRIYMDINAAWTEQECENIYQLSKQKKVYVSEGEESLTLVTASNSKELFATLRKKQFSIFPFFKVAKNSLVITKSSSVSPDIDDIRGSKFLQQTYDYFNTNAPVRVYDIGDELSPYLKSLKECRLLQYAKGNNQQLNDFLSKSYFISAFEDDSEQPIHSSGIAIKRTDTSGNESAPDHIMRLFAYNHILHQAGISLLSDSPDGANVIKEAEQAYVVSPFSSLIVLETQKDYDRFDITSSKNSLQNASGKSKGAVPEPHEWVLIFLVIILCTILRFRPQLLLIKK